MARQQSLKSCSWSLHVFVSDCATIQDSLRCDHLMSSSQMVGCVDSSRCTKFEAHICIGSTMLLERFIASMIFWHVFSDLVVREREMTQRSFFILNLPTTLSRYSQISSGVMLYCAYCSCVRYSDSDSSNCLRNDHFNTSYVVKSRSPKGKARFVSSSPPSSLLQLRYEDIIRS